MLEIRTVCIPADVVRRKWVYSDDGGHFHFVPNSSKWVRNELISKAVIQTSFAPVLKNGTEKIGRGGRVRMTKNLAEVRKLCSGMCIEKTADVWKEYESNWVKSSLHSCEAVCSPLLLLNKSRMKTEN